MALNSPLEIKKMKQGMSYSGKEKTIIMNVFKYFRSQFSEDNVTEIVRKTAKATGCSEKSIFSFRKEEVSPEGFKEPSKKKIRKNVNINNRLVKYDKTTRDGIRSIIYDLKDRNVVPSLSVILKNINCNDALPKFSLMTLRRLLFDMGFYYEKNGTKTVLLEKGVGESNKLQKFANSENIPSNTQPIVHFAEDKVKSQQTYNGTYQERVPIPIDHGYNHLNEEKTVMLPHRMVSYTVHSVGPPPYYMPNMDFKREEPIVSYTTTHLLPQNMLIQ